MWTSRLLLAEASHCPSSLAHRRCAACLETEAGLRVCTYLHSSWPRDTTTTAALPQAANSLDESEEKHSWLAERRALGSLVT